MKDLFEAIGNLLLEFTWKRFVGFILLILSLLLGLYFFEKQTNSLQLARIERSVAVLKQIQEIEAKEIKDPIKKKILTDITTQLVTAVKPVEVNIKLPQLLGNITKPEAKWKFLSGAAIWWIFAVIAAVQVYKKSDKNAPDVFMQFIIVGVSSGIISAFFPTYELQSINYLLYPAASLLFVLAIVGILALAFDFRKRMLEIKLDQTKQSGTNNIDTLEPHPNNDTALDIGKITEGQPSKSNQEEAAA